jgi:hypothetical protein
LIALESKPEARAREIILSLALRALILRDSGAADRSGRTALVPPLWRQLPNPLFHFPTRTAQYGDQASPFPFVERCVMSRLQLCVLLLLGLPVAVGAADTETLPSPRPTTPPPVVRIPVMPVQQRVSDYEHWQYYGVTRSGRFRPLVITLPALSVCDRPSAIGDALRQRMNDKARSARKGTCSLARASGFDGHLPYHSLMQ